MPSDKRYRVVQAGTGNVGSVSLRAIIEHPLMDLVGVLVYSDGKVGKDAGELCGLGRDTGIKATKRFEDVLALEADAVAYMPSYTDFDDVGRLLASGKNVATTRGDFLNPATLTPDERRIIEEGCNTGGTSIRSLGSSPGTATEMFPLILLSYQRRLDCLTINEYANLTSRTNSHNMMFNQMGFGGPATCEAAGKFMLTSLPKEFGGSLRLVAEGLGIELDEIKMITEVGAAREDHQTASGLIPKGTTAAFRHSLDGMYKGKAILRYRAHWFCTANIDTLTGDAWGLDTDTSGFLIRCEGDASWDMRITYPVSAEYYPKLTPTLAAYPVVNMIPQLCAASPGIRTTLNFPVPQTTLEF